MSLSDKSIEEFKEIYKKEHGKEISDAEAREGAQNLINFVELLFEGSLKDAKLKRRLKSCNY
jgi:hypothetical protein